MPKKLVWSWMVIHGSQLQGSCNQFLLLANLVPKDTAAHENDGALHVITGTRGGWTGAIFISIRDISPNSRCWKNWKYRNSKNYCSWSWTNSIRTNRLCFALAYSSDQKINWYHRGVQFCINWVSLGGFVKDYARRTSVLIDFYFLIICYCISLWQTTFQSLE